ncbi:hypothetical protein TVAG_139680 [Trichomonas vaginalis G3]|uniref:SCD domain-containing protein n=1 Tax=Trichomonas vaginalis (strain ATCC PRA-98 / G3) TaxID=412133 RepID=A2EJ35_TRIV3|nr:SCC3-like chromosomal segregation protein A [Trichomonas vaginalis G3]EAY07338.1 hypothetical protein TVAG_139680 [Trichomonas vaginalis G3]KAI5524511.1 SCC3-like chromosomal segregation protein A [Trichomonas vaginalis G3]|eukprot:XP_001319561.1 hypothetical protein [Trichomonas vaginalis G3]
MSSKASPKRSKKPRVEDIDPDLLPPEMTHVGPHDPVTNYFTDDDPKSVLEKFADFYEKRPKIAVRELVNAIVFIAGSKYEITETQFLKSQYEIVMDEIEKTLQDNNEESEVSKTLTNSSSKSHDFWIDLGNALIVCKGLFKDEFDTFKSWCFNFCDSKIRVLRQSATVAVLALTEFLADSMRNADSSIEKLEKESNKSAVKKRQLKDFQDEKSSAKALIMEFFTTVIKTRIRDTNNELRILCTKVIYDLSSIVPEFRDDNFMKYIGTSLQDDNARVKKEGLKLAKNLLEKCDDEDEIKKITPFFKRNIGSIISLCDDNDNGLVIPAFELLTQLSNKKMLRDAEKADVVFKITADDSANVRNAAAKFFSQIHFAVPKKKGSANQELFEGHIRKFAELCSDFSVHAIQNSVEAFFKTMKALQEFELMAQIILSEDDEDEVPIFGHILAAAAKSAGEKDHKSVPDMTAAIIGHFTSIIDKYNKNEELISELIECSQYFDLGSIEKAAGSKVFKDFMKAFHNLFIKSDSKVIYNNIIKSLVRWSQNEDIPSKLKKEVDNEINNLKKEFKNPKKDAEKFAKLLAIVTFYDLSGDEELRDMLKESIDVCDEDASALALECLENIFKWDVMRIKNDEDQKMDYTREFNSFLSLFSLKLHNDDIDVKEAAFKCLSTLISLARLAGQKPVDDTTVSIFFKAFHELKNKEILFQWFTRPLTCGAVDSKYAVHVLWYTQDNALKGEVKNFMTNVSDIFPVDGTELGNLVRTLKYNENKLKAAMKVIARKITPRGAIDSWLDEPDDSLLPIYAPVLEIIDRNDAELLEDRDGITPQTKEVLSKRAHGKKLSAADFVVKSKSKKSKSSSEASSSSSSSSASASSDSSSDNEDSDSDDKTSSTSSEKSNSSDSNQTSD